MRTLILVTLLAAAGGIVSAGQSPLEEAKAHYAAASYEEALSSLTRASNGSSSRVEVEQYRALCLIALGRTAEAERAVAALVEADPKYRPSPSIASPRVITLVSEMRNKELPAVARRLLESGRAAYKQKDFGRAQQDLALLLQILDEPSMKGRPETEDMRVIADGFASLASASLKPEPAAPAAPAVPTTETVAVDTLTDPVAISQDVPAWTPPNALAAAREYTGAIRVRIGADGRVKSAVIERATHPAYDAQLLQASRQWLYKPATRNGQPIESERVIPIQLRPRG